MASGGLAYLRVPLLNAQTAITTTSAAINVLGYTALTVYVIGAGTISAGVLTIEEADINPNFEAAGYTGTWSAVTTYTLTGVSGGAQAAVHLTVSAYGYVRVRISTGVTGAGGSVSCVLVAV
jgi:hypothetical protein